MQPQPTVIFSREIGYWIVPIHSTMNPPAPSLKKSSTASTTAARTDYISNTDGYLAAATYPGDSLSRNQWLSMLCMIHSSVPTTNYTVNISGVKDMTTYTFTDYGLKVTYHHNLYLVDIVKRRFGRVLNLNTVTAGKLWLGVDYLIFNTWHWWNRRGASQPFDYIQDGSRISKDMDRLVAFGKAIVTWGQWVDANVVQNKTKVFFQGMSPSHYNGTDWGDPKAKSCYCQKIPVLTSVYPGAKLPVVVALKNSLKTIKKPVTLLDITNLLLLRKDGHPSAYGFGATDCSHWCLAGVPDTWNIWLYNLMLGKENS